MKVVISAGGTGGHIYPALAILNKIKEMEPDSEFLYIGTHNRMEKDIVPAKGIPFESIEIYGINRKKPLKNFKTLKCFIESQKKVKRLLKEFNPDVVIGVGGYVTGPVIKTAHKLGFKTFIHEQNSVAGKANLYLSRYSDRIGVSFKSSMGSFPKSKTVFTGNPVSEEALKAKPMKKSELGLNDNKKLVLFVTGSLGSGRVNDVLVKTMKQFENKDYQALFITGKGDYEKVNNNSFPKNVKVVPYLDDMSRILKNTDLIVTRAGASTLSEIIALNIPSILIPSPYVPNNHQYKNAMDLVDKNAALLLEEKDLSGNLIASTVDELMNDNNKLESMKKNLDSLKINDSALKIYGILKELKEEK